MAAETGLIHTPFRKVFKRVRTHTQVFLKKVRKVWCAFSDSGPQSRKAVIKKVETKESTKTETTKQKSQLIKIAHTYALAQISYEISVKKEFFHGICIPAWLWTASHEKSSRGIKCHRKSKFSYTLRESMIENWFRTRNKQTNIITFAIWEHSRTANKTVPGRKGKWVTEMKRKTTSR